jgi:CheY-like chemotaxis protein
MFATEDMNPMCYKDHPCLVISLSAGFPLKYRLLEQGGMGALSLRYNAVSAILYPTVLVAEDSTDTRIMLKRAFELKGYRVFEAEDGQQAFDLARRINPSLIVIDLNMPVLDGLETSRTSATLEGEGDHTQSSPSLPTTFTAWKKRRSKRLQRYLSKPLDLEELDRAAEKPGLPGLKRSESRKDYPFLTALRIQHVTPSNS